LVWGMERINNKRDRLRISNNYKNLNLSESKHKNLMRNTVIVGWNYDALRLYDKIKSYPALGYNVKGFITLLESFEEGGYQDVPLLGDLNSLHSWSRLLSIEHILIDIEPSSQAKLPEIINCCRKIGITYTIVSDVYDTVFGNVIHEVYEDLFSSRELGLRRFIDFFGATLLMIVLFPLFMLIAIAIKLESKGAVFYSQIRVGKSGREFRIFKFRSMFQDAEKYSGPIWAQKNDPRVTKVGRFIRLTRIDELPQLMNILKGDMSFIGPRPERPFFVESFKQQIPLYQNRLKAKPGVTGWAQVMWRYDESLEDVKEKLNFDLYYINNHNLWLDIKIFFLTLKTILLQKGQ
jgi:exopolysaccharide biosynthesis polyprenyl glycosylphosphotransferase